MAINLVCCFALILFACSRYGLHFRLINCFSCEYQQDEWSLNRERKKAFATKKSDCFTEPSWSSRSLRELTSKGVFMGSQILAVLEATGWDFIGGVGGRLRCYVEYVLIEHNNKYSFSALVVLIECSLSWWLWRNISAAAFELPSSFLAKLMMRLKLPPIKRILPKTFLKLFTFRKLRIEKLTNVN